MGNHDDGRPLSIQTGQQIHIFAAVVAKATPAFFVTGQRWSYAFGLKGVTWPATKMGSVSRPGTHHIAFQLYPRPHVYAPKLF